MAGILFKCSQKAFWCQGVREKGKYASGKDFFVLHAVRREVRAQREEKDGREIRHNVLYTGSVAGKVQQADQKVL